MTAVVPLSKALLRSPPGTSKGAALLVILFLVLAVFSTLIVSQLSKANLEAQKQKKTQQALAQAKEALLAYASTFERPGALPCPDTNNAGSGNPDGNVKCYSRIGRLPWKQLGLPDLRDGDGERLWYAVSAEFANVPSTQVVNNEESKGLINVCGPTGCGDSSPIPIPPATFPLPTTNIAAIVFSPGGPIGSNNRQDGTDSEPDPAKNTDPAKKPSNYLDNVQIDAKTFDNSSGTTNGNDFVAANHSGTFNDQLLPISVAEIFTNVNRRMENRATLVTIASCIAEYGINNSTSSDHRLPWSAALSIDVDDASQFGDVVSLRSGRLPFSVGNSAKQTSVHTWATSAISATKRNTLAACSNFPKWWPSWKSYLFYVVASNFSPDFDSGSAPSPNSCSSPSGCLSVNGGVGKFAAIVVFSGRKLAAQTRSSPAEQRDPSNYLEEANLSSIKGSGTDFFSGEITTSFNDTIVCINPDMTISPDCI